MKTHTPTPWAFNVTRYEIIGANGKHVALLPERGCLRADVAAREADAAFIVRAVNSHAALLSALKEWIGKYDTFDEAELRRCYPEDVRARILRSRAAIARAEGE